MVLNLDIDLTADTSRFACFASTPTNDMATVVPGGCMAGQSTNSFPVDKNGNNYGAKITTTSSDTCPTNPPASDGDTPSVNVPLAIGLGIGVPILLYPDYGSLLTVSVDILSVLIHYSLVYFGRQ